MRYHPVFTKGPPDTGISILLQQIISPNQPLWIFAYGSLMWNPGFCYAEMQTIQIFGHHRALCVWSWHYRGNQQQPGLVFGLDQGGSCIGIAFRIKTGEQNNVLKYLYSREMITQVYRPSLVRIRLADGQEGKALTFIVDRSHPQYAGRLQHETLWQIIRQARGSRGPNHEYVRHTLDKLESMGSLDRQLRLLGSRLSGIRNCT